MLCNAYTTLYDATRRSPSYYSIMPRVLATWSRGMVARYGRAVLPAALAALLLGYLTIGRREAREEPCAKLGEGAVDNRRACRLHQPQQEAQVVDARQPVVK